MDEPEFNLDEVEAQPLDELVDTTRFRLVRKLAEGGMGAVFDAIQYGVEGFDKRVAIKTIREDFTYADEGYTSQVVNVGDMTPGGTRTFSYRYNSPSGDWDIGRLEIWLRCDRGRAYKIRRWSYASW